MATTINMDVVAAEVGKLLAVIEAEDFRLVRANVSHVYKTQRKTEAEPSWRVCVSVNDCRVWIPGFRAREDAEAYRDAAINALDRVA